MSKCITELLFKDKSQKATLYNTTHIPQNFRRYTHILMNPMFRIGVTSEGREGNGPGRSLKWASVSDF